LDEVKVLEWVIEYLSLLHEKDIYSLQHGVKTINERIDTTSSPLMIIEIKSSTIFERGGARKFLTLAELN
jgi:hypothetical protein